MKQHIDVLLQAALKQLQISGEVPENAALAQVEATKDNHHGDFATNIAMVLAHQMQKTPREIAERIIEKLPSSPYLQKAEMVDPGFINFFLTVDALTSVVKKVLAEKETYGKCKIGRDKRVIVEFLSATPIGPLHVGHGRIAAYGAVISRLLDTVGFRVYKEYYVNDIGRQIDILTVSIWLRYLALCGEEIVFPTNAYHGDYVMRIAKSIHDLHGDHFKIPAQQIYENLPVSDNQDAYLDEIIERTKKSLADNYNIIFNFVLYHVLADIREDLAEFGVHYDNWFSERQFASTAAVDKMLQKLKDSNHVYEQDHALWFRSTDFSDDRNRMLVSEHGQPTFFANDVAYHLSKFERGFDLAIDIFGADYHGYIVCMKAAMQACEINPERLQQLLLQFVTLYRDGAPVQMSTRGSAVLTLRELREEIGNDAARFFYVMRKHEQHVDFDLDLAKAKSDENPVYYVQYAYARICGVFRQLTEKNMSFDEATGLAHVALLTQPQERRLLNTISHYPDMIINAALQYEPHQLTNYVRELAADFHAYYDSHQFIVEDEALRNARLALIAATRQTLLNGFNLIGVGALENM